MFCTPGPSCRLLSILLSCQEVLCSQEWPQRNTKISLHCIISGNLLAPSPVLNETWEPSSHETWNFPPTSKKMDETWELSPIERSVNLCMAALLLARPNSKTCLHFNFTGVRNERKLWCDSMRTLDIIVTWIQHFPWECYWLEINWSLRLLVTEVCSHWWTLGFGI